uniref:ATP synthase protein 8 n=1 Tax=Opegrapha vulgata TaxID=543791 RepID=A0A286QSI5_9PEZI|nr:ATP Synthase Subunit 8 [Opegrapha vulgata]ASB29435.1 ATP Synthase Subunit 8 [Opegrapha vulgata]
MPQLVPFYFMNQLFFVYLIMIVSVYFFSKYILPGFVSLFASRMSISKL